MRVLNHDYAGHPFQVQLSRALASRNHEVLHIYSASNQTPHGLLTRQSSDCNSFEVRPVYLSAPFRKYSYWQRRNQEIEYGRLVADEIRQWKPEVVISGNTPTEAQRVIQRRCRAQKSHFIFWVQDVYSVAVYKLLQKKLPVIGSVIGHGYMHMERKILRQSDAVILISEDFRPLMSTWGIEPSRTHVIHNWAPLEDVPLHPKANPWSKQYHLDSVPCLLYSGTLGMKHNPNLLLQLAIRLKQSSHEKVVVISEGPGVEWLRGKCTEHGLDNLIIMSWQPFEVLPEVLASADVLLAVLEADAGVFSVPSKVLTYLCAARALLLAVPPDNLAARIVRDNEAGLLVTPDDVEGFVQAASTLMSDGQLRERLGRNGRRYAERQFNIDTITNKFEDVLQQAVK